jgi:acyl carrier protein
MRVDINKYKSAFFTGLTIDQSINIEELAYDSIPEWDSIGHMGLIAEIESTFSVSFTTDDVINFSSYAEGLKILARLLED